MFSSPAILRKAQHMLEMPNPTEPGPEPRPPGYPNPESPPFPPERAPDWEPGEDNPPGPVIDPMPDPVTMERGSQPWLFTL